MSTALTGERIKRPGTDETRTPINVDAAVVEKLRDLLFQPWMRGVGYSEFIERAVARAYEEADEQGLIESYAATFAPKDTRCIHEQKGEDARCNGGGYDGCACGPYPRGRA